MTTHPCKHPPPDWYVHSWHCNSMGLASVLGFRATDSSVFLPEKSHGQRSLEGYSLTWSHKESDMTK